MVKNLPALQETWVWSLGWEGPLEKGMATHSSILAWRILWTEDLAGYGSWGCKESVTLALFTYVVLGFISTLEKAMAPHSSTLAWKIPWTEDPGGLQSMGSLTVRHDWATSLSRIGEGNGNPLQCSCLENPRDRGAWWAAVSGVAQSWTRLKWLSRDDLMCTGICA